MRLLLLSSSRVDGLGYLEYAKPTLGDFLVSVERLLFVPYAAVTLGWDHYVAMVQAALTPIGVAVEGIHRLADPQRAVAEARAVAIGGGNTWQLARELHLRGLLDPIRRAVRSGTPYIGWSAGANIACPTFQTTNDMPICDPLGFDALDLVPFQINPHYLDGNPPGFHGETREARILEYLERHPEVWVVGLREGTLLRIEAGTARLVGSRPCRVFRRGEPPREFDAGDDLAFLVRGDRG